LIAGPQYVFGSELASALIEVEDVIVESDRVFSGSCMTK